MADNSSSDYTKCINLSAILNPLNIPPWLNPQTVESQSRFILGGVTCKFSKEEVALITGLPFHGKALDLHSKKVSDIHLLQKHYSSTPLHKRMFDRSLFNSTHQRRRRARRTLFGSLLF
ncbi:hypothetical protein QJS10_CPB12g00373 [Acorus calamus]|uniref:Uncharacterized protein n=1 Tax=Acorus calamus TaxID=4465 RepID=A0AAV9DPG8_ACOCL|nr:hypothetical protein QJS10_CPB12g00373 [Acorus calamus]